MAEGLSLSVAQEAEHQACAGAADPVMPVHLSQSCAILDHLTANPTDMAGGSDGPLYVATGALCTKPYWRGGRSRSCASTWSLSVNHEALASPLASGHTFVSCAHAGGADVHAVSVSARRIEWSCRCSAACLSVDAADTDYGHLIVASAMDSIVTLISAPGRILHRCKLNARILPKVQWLRDRKHVLVATGQASLVLLRLTMATASEAERASDDDQCLALVKVQTLELGSNATHFVELSPGTLDDQSWPAILCSRRDASTLALYKLVEEGRELRMFQVMCTQVSMSAFAAMTWLLGFCPSWSLSCGFCSAAYMHVGPGWPCLPCACLAAPTIAYLQDTMCR
jgi:hypothetical protein